MPEPRAPSELPFLADLEAVASGEVGRAWVRPAILLGLFLAMIVAVRVGGVSVSAEGLRAWTRGLGPWAPAAVLACYLGRPLVLIPITPLWLATGALFDWPAGALWAMAGTNLGAAVGFGLARHLGRDFVERRFGPRVRRWATFPADRATRTVLALQLTPIMPHDLINNLAGVSRMTYRSFLTGSFLGTVPVILIYTYAGHAVLDVPSPGFWAAAALLTAMTIVMLAWNRRLARQRAGPRNPGGGDAEADSDGAGDGGSGPRPGMPPGSGR